MVGAGGVCTPSPHPPPTKHTSVNFCTMSVQYSTKQEVPTLYNRLIWQEDGNVSRGRESARKGLNTTSGVQFAALPLVKPVV